MALLCQEQSSPSQGCDRGECCDLAGIWHAER